MPPPALSQARPIHKALPIDHAEVRAKSVALTSRLAYFNSLFSYVVLNPPVFRTDYKLEDALEETRAYAQRLEGKVVDGILVRKAAPMTLNQYTHALKEARDHAVELVDYKLRNRNSGYLFSSEILDALEGDIERGVLDFIRDKKFMFYQQLSKRPVLLDTVVEFSDVDHIFSTEYVIPDPMESFIILDRKTGYGFSVPTEYIGGAKKRIIQDEYNIHVNVFENGKLEWHGVEILTENGHVYEWHESGMPKIHATSMDVRISGGFSIDGKNYPLFKMPINILLDDGDRHAPIGGFSDQEAMYDTIDLSHKIDEKVSGFTVPIVLYGLKKA